MHFFKEYIENYNETKSKLNTILNEIEIQLDKLLGIKKIVSIDECKIFLEINKECFENISNSISKIIETLNLLQIFCYDDIKKILPFISEFKYLDEHEAFLKAKNIDLLIEYIKKDKDTKTYEKNNILEIAEFNKKVRYFVHTTLAIVENPSTYVIQKKLQKNIKENKFLHSSEDLYYEVNYLLNEVFRIKRLLEQYHILSNSSYGNWNSSMTTIKQLLDYLTIYKNRFEGFYFNEEIYFIKLEVRNTIDENRKIYIPEDRIKEIIDVLLHNAADELVSKQLELGDFEKIIICELEETSNEIVLKVQDNGRGFEDDNLIRPFISTKYSRFHNQGIGLDIANTNCMIISGKLEISNSKETGGAIFKFIFPKHIKANTDIFKFKINIAIFGKSISTIEKVEELKQTYKENKRIIRINTKDELRTYLQNASLNALDIIVIDKNEIDLNKELKKYSFKGQYLSV
jgi:hypothetical protein